MGVAATILPIVSLLQTKGATDTPPRKTEDHGNLGKR